MVRYFERNVAANAAKDGSDVDTEKPTYDWLEEHG